MRIYCFKSLQVLLFLKSLTEALFRNLVLTFINLLVPLTIVPKTASAWPWKLFRNPPLLVHINGLNITNEDTGESLSMIEKGVSMDEGTLRTPIPYCRLYWLLCLGWWSNFVDSKSGQKQSVKLLQNMVYSTIEHPPPPTPPPTATHCPYILYI